MIAASDWALLGFLIRFDSPDDTAFRKLSRLGR
jgi:hypothetical protein